MTLPHNSIFIFCISKKKNLPWCILLEFDMFLISAISSTLEISRRKVRKCHGLVKKNKRLLFWCFFKSWAFMNILMPGPELWIKVLGVSCVWGCILLRFVVFARETLNTLIHQRVPKIQVQRPCYAKETSYIKILLLCIE